jgi:hypothetical protein
VLVVALAVLAVLGFWSAWRWRRVDFIHQLTLGAETDAVAAQVFDQVIPVLVEDGYTMVAQGRHTTVFEHRFFPAWTVLVSIFFFPLGLIALLARAWETVVIVSADGVLGLHRYCGKATADFIVDVADDAAARLAFAR